MIELKMYPSLDLTLLQEKARYFVGRYPKLAVKLFFKVGTNIKIIDILRIPLIEDI